MAARTPQGNAFERDRYVLHGYYLYKTNQLGPDGRRIVHSMLCTVQAQHNGKVFMGLCDEVYEYAADWLYEPIVDRFFISWHHKSKADIAQYHGNFGFITSEDELIDYDFTRP